MAETKKDILDSENFFNEVIKSYNEGKAYYALPADKWVARSLVPAGTAEARDFSYIDPNIPTYNPDNCIACMECVNVCPDSAIFAKVVTEEDFNAKISSVANDKSEFIKSKMAKSKKFWELREKKNLEKGLFTITINPKKCKGCGECVVVCGSKNALSMIKKDDKVLENNKAHVEFVRHTLPPTKDSFINEKILLDMFLKEDAWLYVGGAGSCMGCGETTALRMMLGATGYKYGKESVALFAATGCNSVYSSTYPFNPMKVPWSNSLFENAATFAMGARLRWDQIGRNNKKIWAIGGDGALYDIGFQPLSRLLASNMNVNVLCLDTQAYSNTGGQASTATFHGQEAKMAAHGKAIPGKSEMRKELAMIATMHPGCFVAQTTPMHFTHFMKAIIAANEFDGPSLINVYTACMPEHGIGDNEAYEQAKLAVDSRAFPLFIYDPRKGESYKERFDLTGNPAQKDDWKLDPDGNPVDFIAFAKKQGRFRKQFKGGQPSDVMHAANHDRLINWRHLQEISGTKQF